MDSQGRRNYTNGDETYIMFSSIKIAIILAVLATAGGGFVYVKGLQADLATSEANNLVLENIKAEQDAVIEQMKKDFEAINKAKKELETALAAAEKDNKELAGKFAQYDIALWGMENPEAAEKTINRAVRHVNRCMEVASGSPVEPKDFYNRQCRELMKERFSKAGMPYEQPKEESTE
jgi:multidrug efflux pump subunit AcrB